jgi:hypothetical protein
MLWSPQVSLISRAINIAAGSACPRVYGSSGTAAQMPSFDHPRKFYANGTKTVACLKHLPAQICALVPRRCSSGDVAYCSTRTDVAALNVVSSKISFVVPDDAPGGPVPVILKLNQIAANVPGLEATMSNTLNFRVLPIIDSLSPGIPCCDQTAVGEFSPLTRMSRTSETSRSYHIR